MAERRLPVIGGARGGPKPDLAITWTTEATALRQRADLQGPHSPERRWCKVYLTSRRRATEVRLLKIGDAKRPSLWQSPGRVAAISLVWHAELPRDDAGGMPRIHPVTTHNLQLFDFATRRGMLVVSGVENRAPAGGHVVRSGDGKAALWMGNVDDLFHFGPPRDTGGPWHNTPVRGGESSDAYLMCGYDRKTLCLTADTDVAVSVEVDVDASGHWHTFSRLRVQPGRTSEYVFPAGYSAHWLRVVADRDTVASALLVYE